MIAYRIILADTNRCGDDPASTAPPGPCTATVNPNTGASDAAFRQFAPLNANLTWITLAVSLAVVLGGVSLWVFGAQSQNSDLSIRARRFVVGGFVAAFFLGAMPHLIQFWINTGRGITP